MNVTCITDLLPYATHKWFNDNFKHSILKPLKI